MPLGYVVISVDGQKYMASALAHFWMTGVWPDYVRHLDGDRANDAWANLESKQVRAKPVRIPRFRKRAKRRRLIPYAAKDSREAPLRDPGLRERPFDGPATRLLTHITQGNSSTLR